jgi:hypothetical protein
MTALDTASERLLDWATDIRNEAKYDDADPLVIARHIAGMQEAAVLLATACVEEGIRAGLTQKALAEALNVPLSALRGARREVLGA